MRQHRVLRFRACLFLALALGFQIETLLLAPRSDSAAWLFMGGRQAHGQMPGRDLWDNKLPLIFLIGRAAMATGHPQAALWLLESVLTALGALAVSALVTWRPNGRGAEEPGSKPDARGGAATLAGSLVCILSGVPAYHAGGYMTETYAMPLSAIAAWLTLRMIRRPDARVSALAAGLLWAITVSFRLPMGLTALALAAYGAIKLPGRALVRVAPFVLLGIFFGGFLVCVHPLIAGYLRACIDAAIRWPLGWSGGRIAGPLVLTTVERFSDFAQDIIKLGWVHAAAVAGILAARRGCQRTIAGFAATWYLAALASSAMGWASYAHYQYVALAPACFCAGLLIRALPRKLAGRIGPALVAVSMTVVVAQVAREVAKYRHDDSDADRSAVVRYIHDHTTPDESVLIWSWGRSADLLYRIDRPPGNRHFLGHSYFDMDQGLFAEMVDTLIAAPPRWIVDDPQRDEPSLRGPNPEAWRERVSSLPRLQDFIRSAYRQVASFGRFAILQYRGAGALRQGPDEPNRD